MKKYFHVVATGLGLAGWLSVAQAQITAGADSGFGTFQTKCMTCHGKPNMANAPAPASLRELPPEKIYQVLATGATSVHQSLGLTDDQKRRAAEAISYRLIGSAESADAKLMPNRCADN